VSIQVSTRIDEKTKQQFDAICDRIGISPSNALSIFIKGVINNNGIPFAVMAPPVGKESISAVYETDQSFSGEVGGKAGNETDLVYELEDSEEEDQVSKSNLDNYENFFRKWEVGRKAKNKATQSKL